MLTPVALTNLADFVAAPLNSFRAPQALASSRFRPPTAGATNRATSIAHQQVRSDARNTLIPAWNPLVHGRGGRTRLSIEHIRGATKAITTREKASARLLARVIEEAIKAAALSRSETVALVHVTHAISFTFLRAEE